MSASSRMTPAKLARESERARKARTIEIRDRLDDEYPGASTALDFETPLQLLVATILSAQCTDARVNQVTPALFRRFPTASGYAEADLAEMEQMVKSTGFFRNKARALVGLGQALVSDHAGEVPGSMEELVRLPGVGRKTANVVLGNAFGLDEGIVVDTHVKRLARLLGLTSETDPVKVEVDLMALVPRADWTRWAHLLILHGRAVCRARRPQCSQCVLVDRCPSAEI